MVHLYAMAQNLRPLLVIDSFQWDSLPLSKSYAAREVDLYLLSYAELALSQLKPQTLTWSSPGARDVGTR